MNIDSAHLSRCASSPTVPTGDQTDADVLRERRRAWEARPLTREVYRRYFEAISAALAPGAWTLELGGGAGNFKSHRPRTIVTDLVTSPFVDLVADAMALPFARGRVDNLVMVDVLHHLPRPARFFAEAVRVLRLGGRLIMFEPFISPFSRLVFRLAHPEPVDVRADPLPDDDGPVFAATGAFASNQATPTLMFFNKRARFEQRFPELIVRTRRLDSVFVYPLSGGFSGPCLIPRFAWPLAWMAERALLPLRRWLAFRLFVVLERR